MLVLPAVDDLLAFVLIAFVTVDVVPVISAGVIAPVVAVEAAVAVELVAFEDSFVFANVEVVTLPEGVDVGGLLTD